MSDAASDLVAPIEAGWADRAGITPATDGAVRAAVEAAVAGLDNGTLRVAAPDGAGGWRVNQWLKQAVLLSFRLSDNSTDARRARQDELVGQGPVEVRWLGRGSASPPPVSARCRAASSGAGRSSRRASS